MIVALTGYAGAGKDAAGAVFAHRGYTHRKFAAPLKELAARCGWNGEKDDVGRAFLQALGAGARDIIDPDVWVRPAMANLTGDVVFTDCRYPNEWDAIKDAGGYIVRVWRPGLGPINGHESETAVDSLTPDHVIVNSGSLIELREHVHVLIDALERLTPRFADATSQEGGP